MYRGVSLGVFVIFGGRFAGTLHSEYQLIDTWQEMRQQLTYCNLAHQSLIFGQLDIRMIYW